MTVQHLNQLVQSGADARFDEVIERLLFILDTPPFPTNDVLLNKWNQTGLLDGFEDERLAVAIQLETKARELVAMYCNGTPPSDDYAVDQLCGVLRNFRETHDRY